MIVTSSQAPFATTRWTLVLGAQDASNPSRRSALGDLLGLYWRPVYAFLRRSGEERASAEDLTQAFFLDLLERGFPDGVERGRGRFRTYLLACLRHFRSKERERERAAKRGGGKVVPIDPETVESILPSRDEPPEVAFDRQWSWDVLSRALVRLEGEWSRSGRERMWSVYREFVRRAEAGEAPRYGELAQSHGVSEAFVTNALHRARARLRELVAEEVRETCSDPEELPAEIDALLRAMIF